MARRRITIIISVVVLVALFCVSGIYLSTYSRAEAVVAEALKGSQHVTVMEVKGKELVFVPSGKPEAGFVFYPGGKVEYTAYAPMMEALAERGILCILLHMPCNLAILDASAADGVTELFPMVEKWYIGGHSLGGAAASMYVSSDKNDTFSGLVLLGAYSTKDLKGKDLKVLSVYGSEDGVLNRKNYEKDLANLPSDFTEIVVEGGCHAYFGYYGPQKGDGTPTVDRDEQQKITVDTILKMMEG